MTDPSFEASGQRAQEDRRDLGFEVPTGAWDCHVHIFDRRFPYVATRKYTPPDALPADLSAMLSRLGIDRALVVQASPFGSDNRCASEAVGSSGGRFLAAAVLDPAATEATVADLHAAGFRAVRLNYAGLGSVEPLRAQLRLLGELAPILAARGWHVETHLPPALFEEVIGDEALRRLPVVVDHFGLSGVAAEDMEAGMRRIGQLLGNGRLWVKLSASYRLGKGEVGLERAARATEVYLAENPERLLWASDWPHTPPHPKASSAEQIVPFRDIDPADLLRFLGRTVPRTDHSRRILVDNPEHLLGVE